MLGVRLCRNPQILLACLLTTHLSTLKQVGGERYNLFTGCPKARTATFVLRGGSEQVTSIPWTPDCLELQVTTFEHILLFSLC